MRAYNLLSVAYGAALGRLKTGQHFVSERLESGPMALWLFPIMARQKSRNGSTTPRVVCVESSHQTLLSPWLVRLPMGNGRWPSPVRRASVVCDGWE
jgi:hypothetical protein